MQRFKNILAVVDQTRRDDVFLYRAASLAADNKGRLKVVGVTEDLPDLMTKKMIAHFQVDIETIIREERLEQLRRIESRYQPLVPITTKLLTGTPFIEIIREVIRGSHDLLVIQTASDGKVRTGLFGSTELHLLRKCPCPVWIFRQSESKRFNSIVAAVNVNSSGPDEDELNRKILELSYSLSQIDRSEFHVVHCWHPIGEDLLRARGGAQGDVDDYLRISKSNITAKLNECLAPFDRKTANMHVHLLKGEPEILVPNLVRREQTGLLVMGTLARSGINGLLIGNIAEKIVNEVECSLLVVKPERFSCPIKA